MQRSATQSSAGMTFSKKPSCYAELRYHKPQQSRPVLMAGLQLNKAMGSAKLETILARSASVPLMRLPGSSPTPVIVQIKGDRVGGPVGGDVHGSNTNPGFSRNPLGGFYTQIV